MAKKLIPVIFLVVILGITYVAWRLYSEKNILTKEKESLEERNVNLTKEYENLNYKYQQIESEKKRLEKRGFEIERELSRLESEKETWRRKYESVSQERDILAEKLKSVSALAPQPARVEETGDRSEEYWADFIQKKAELEASVANFRREIAEAKSRIAEIDNNNKELEIRIDQLRKERDILIKEMKFKEEAMRILSRDLIKEREKRNEEVGELSKLRDENMNLKRELIIVNKEKLQLESDITKTMEKKETMEKKVSEVESILKEKALVLEEIHEDLARAVKREKEGPLKKSASVELPPIVVRPETSGIKGLQGEIITVNREEKFVVINIGEFKGLKLGLPMKVMRKGKEIGKVEIIETRKEISAADIKEEFSGFTIQEGDIVISE